MTKEVPQKASEEPSHQDQLKDSQSQSDSRAQSENDTRLSKTKLPKGYSYTLPVVPVPPPSSRSLRYAQKKRQSDENAVVSRKKVKSSLEEENVGVSEVTGSGFGPKGVETARLGPLTSTMEQSGDASPIDLKTRNFPN